jgi:small GTP-binding protein
MSNEPLPVLRAVLVGDRAVGKTSLLHRINGDPFISEYNPTVGGGYIELALDGGVKIGLWDTAGGEEYRSVIPVYFRDAALILIVFDLTATSSFAHVTDWAQIARSKAPEGVDLFLIGNKSDNVTERVVEFESAQTVATQIVTLAYLETSAQSGDGLPLLLSQLNDAVERRLQAATPPTPPPVVQPLGPVEPAAVEAVDAPTCC